MNETKSILLSLTFWGVVVAVAAEAAKRYGIVIDQAAWANDLAALAGSVVAVIGRYKATKQVTITGAPK